MIFRPSSIVKDITIFSSRVRLPAFARAAFFQQPGKKLPHLTHLRVHIVHLHAQLLHLALQITAFTPLRLLTVDLVKFTLGRFHLPLNFTQISSNATRLLAFTFALLVQFGQ